MWLWSLGCLAGALKPGLSKLNVKHHSISEHSPKNQSPSVTSGNKEFAPASREIGSLSLGWLKEQCLLSGYVPPAWHDIQSRPQRYSPAGQQITCVSVPCAFRRAWRCDCKPNVGGPNYHFDSSPSAEVTRVAPASWSVLLSILPVNLLIAPVIAVRDHNYWAYQLPCFLQAHKSKSCLKSCGLCSHGARPVPSLCSPPLLSWGYYPFPSLTAFLTLHCHLPFPGTLNFSSFCCLPPN